jgi:hypothetical protein
MPQTKANPDEFTLDRERLTAKMLDDYGEPVGINSFGESDPERVAGAIRYATYGGAVTCPAEISLIVDALPPVTASVILSLCESHEVRAHQGMQRRIDAGLSDERQVSMWSLETESLIDRDNTEFQGFCSMLEAVCAHATRLLPSLRAMLDGEQRLLDRIAEPLTVLTYDTRARPDWSRSSVEAFTQGVPEQARVLWSQLIVTLEEGEDNGEWDGDRQRALTIEEKDRPYLARQLLALREGLIANGDASAEQLPEPEDGLAAYLA